MKRRKVRRKSPPRGTPRKIPKRQDSKGRIEAHAAFRVVPLPEGAVRLPRAGGLKSAVLFVLHASTPRALTTKEIGQHVEALAWAPVGWSPRRLATVLWEMATVDGLLAEGPSVQREENDSGPLDRKTWRFGPATTKVDASEPPRANGTTNAGT